MENLPATRFRFRMKFPPGDQAVPPSFPASADGALRGRDTGHPGNQPEPVLPGGQAMKRNRGLSPAAQAQSLESRVLFASTSDPLFESQYALANTAVADAWDTTRGSAAVVVAGIDTGADY